MPKQISVISYVKDTYKEEFVAYQLVEAQINPSLSHKMRHYLIDVLYTYKNSFSSYNEPLGAIKGNEVDITVNIDRPYPSVLRRPAYPASSRAREALEKPIQELIQLGVLRKVGHNEKFEGQHLLLLLGIMINQGWLEILEHCIPTQLQIGIQFLEFKKP
ncbi:hypothetical protein O181_089443 [Austropuccinia psidii MF-1]|uniref:Uncharacterized protein n=1 Tax=Austropuccinia psidii MF-1 TaxID=1389203 RepID=A0A9Q3IT92_9BASI|nr:hypothetical protein [Austropuccinia psidii MF-1]